MTEFDTDAHLGNRNHIPPRAMPHYQAGDKLKTGDGTLVVSGLDRKASGRPIIIGHFEAKTYGPGEFSYIYREEVIRG